jgi:ferredoxin-NADP reductase
MARFHTLKVKDIRRETADAVSIAFDIPLAIQHEYQFKQGQYIKNCAVHTVFVPALIARKNYV